MNQEKTRERKSTIKQNKNVLELSFNEKFYPNEIINKVVEKYQEAEIKNNLVVLKTKDKEEAYKFYDNLLKIMQGGTAWH